MDIEYLGHSAFKIKTNGTTIITDPFGSGSGSAKSSFPNIEAQIVTISNDHPDHNNKNALSGQPFVIESSGEYEVKGVNVFGYTTYHDKNNGTEQGKNTVYLIEAEGISVCHLGNLGHVLENKIIEELGDIDILLAPVGGADTVDAAKATDVVRQIEPKLVIPMHYQNSKDEKILDSVDKFIKEMGAEAPEHMDRLKVTKDKLPEETKLIILDVVG
jgi:L-ascorbate metabolism protein UlaG (beta-lactamase superfamily)